MDSKPDVRGLARLILALWLLAGIFSAGHVHHDRCEGHDDDAPCPICIVVHDVPIIAPQSADDLPDERNVVAWISPWIAIVPDEVFFDRPLARGPPSPV